MFNCYPVLVEVPEEVDPIYMNSTAGGGSSGVVINWPDDVGIGASAAAADDDDDLYG